MTVTDVPTIIREALRVKGKTEAAELRTLYEWAEIAPDGAAVEVGALHGRSVLVWAAARWGRGVMLVVDDEVRDTLKKTLPDGVRLIQGTSWEQAENLPSLAFCFIDADHGIDAFPKDILPYAAKIKPGGIIAFHDYDGDREEFVVRAYVDCWQRMVGWQELGLVGSLIGFRRPE